jgi:hypothetical protein
MSRSNLRIPKPLLMPGEHVQNVPAAGGLSGVDPALHI